MPFDTNEMLPLEKFRADMAVFAVKLISNIDVVSFPNKIDMQEPNNVFTYQLLLDNYCNMDSQQYEWEQ